MNIKDCLEILETSKDILIYDLLVSFNSCKLERLSFTSDEKRQEFISKLTELKSSVYIKTEERKLDLTIEKFLK